VSRYITKPSAYYDEDDYPSGRQTCEVHEADKSPTWTGLLDQHGNKIYRHPQRIRMGFHGSQAAE
jgi:hypothetical protein